MNIKFVSYDGEYPNLCRGQLILNIDGKDMKFNSPLYGYKDKLRVDYDYERFWFPGGGINEDDDGSMWAESGSWQIDRDYLPDFLKPYVKELKEILNDNIPQGCCGGCI